MSAVAAARAGLVAVGVLVGIVSASRAYDVQQPWLWGSDLAVTVAYCIVAALALPATSRLGILAAGVAVTWAIVAWLPLALFWHRGVLIHLLVMLLAASPALWPQRRWDRVVVVTGYVVSVTPFVWRVDAAAIVLSVALAAAALVLTPGSSGVAGRLAASALVVFALLVAAGAAARLSGLGLEVLEARAVAYAIGMVAVAIMVGIAVRPRSLGRASDAAIELGARPDDAVRDRLATALSDRTLTVGWWMPERGTFETVGGVEVTPPVVRDRAEVIVEADGRPLARVVGAAARLEESGVREAIRRAASLAAENARLTARLREAVHDVERSRARLIQAGDAEQRILARELAYDIGEPLKAVRTALLRLGEPSTPATDSRAVDLVDRALDELSDISHGLHPSALDGGLAEALEVLTRRMPIPIVLQVDDDIDDAVAQVVYYVCAEAVTNAVRHAACGSITVGVTLEGGLVAVLVEDDGRGGATVRPGSGLAGLAARVADGDGTLELASPPGGGTRVLVTLPVERDALRVEVSR